MLLHRTGRAADTKEPPRHFLAGANLAKVPYWLRSKLTACAFCVVLRLGSVIILSVVTAQAKRLQIFASFF